MIFKSTLAVLIALVISVSGICPVMADDNLADASKTTESSTVKPDNSNKSSKLSGAGLAARNITAFVIGAVFGAPIAIARKSAHETVVATRDLVGDTDTWVFIAAGGILGLPAGVLSGTVEGLLASVKNSWVAAPFSKDSFSLGDEI